MEMSNFFAQKCFEDAVIPANFDKTIHDPAPYLGRFNKAVDQIKELWPGIHTVLTVKLPDMVEKNLDG